MYETKPRRETLTQTNQPFFFSLPSPLEEEIERDTTRTKNIAQWQDNQENG
jgi:hypothetical protein